MFWVELIAGVTLWMWLICEFIRPAGLLDKPTLACTGCQRHFIRPGCPIHDTQERNAA